MTESTVPGAKGEEPIGLRYDPFGRMVLELPGGEAVADVVPVRCFPHSAPGAWISFCDVQGREVHCLRSLEDLPEGPRRFLVEDLAARELIPVIRRIHGVSAGPDPAIWHVATDRGETRFPLTSEDQIRRMGARAVLITDAHGVRFRILDVRALDAHSRRILGRYL